MLADSFVVDTHEDVPTALFDKWGDVSKQGGTDHFDIPRAKQGGLGAVFFSIFVDGALADRGATKRAHEEIDITRRVVDANLTTTTLATSVAEIRAAKQAGKLAVLMGIEGGHAIEDSLAVLRAMYREGVRYMTLTHTNTNHWADSAGPLRDPTVSAKSLRKHGGLTDFGRVVVKEMNRLGMIVDISHVSDDTVDDVLEVTRAPVMASHSSCRAISNVSRNLTDDQIKRIGAGGGIVMISFGSGFLDQKVADWYATTGKTIRKELAALKVKFKDDPATLDKETDALWVKRGTPPRAQWTAVVDHIEHVMQVGGEDAVGIGSDFDGIPDPPTGLEDVSKFPKIAAELLKRGHTQAQVDKVLGENFLAYFARVEAAKAKLASEAPATTKFK